MSMGYLFIYLYPFPFLPLMSYSFQCIGLSSPCLNLFLAILHIFSFNIHPIQSSLFNFITMSTESIVLMGRMYVIGFRIQLFLGNHASQLNDDYLLFFHEPVPSVILHGKRRAAICRQHGQQPSNPQIKRKGDMVMQME